MINDLLKLIIQLENDEHHNKRGTHTLAWQECEQHVLSIRRCPSSRGKLYQDLKQEFQLWKKET
jgi:hypothetical protein